MTCFRIPQMSFNVPQFAHPIDIEFFLSGCGGTTIMKVLCSDLEKLVVIASILRLKMNEQTFGPRGCPAPETWGSAFSSQDEFPESGGFNGDGPDDIITFT